MTNKYTQLFHKLSQSNMFRHYRLILRDLVINILPSYTSISNAAVYIVLYCIVLYIVLPTAAFEILIKLGNVLITRSLRMTR